MIKNNSKSCLSLNHYNHSSEVVEFKLNDSAEAALAQIDSKDYALSYNGQGKKIVKIGIEFDKEKRNIGRWVVE